MLENTAVLDDAATHAACLDVEPAATAHDAAPASAANPVPARLLASVVITTPGRPIMLDRCLDALLAQSVDPTAFEIIVCDAGADASSCAAVERRADERRFCGPEIRYIAMTDNAGPAAARNAGWRGARGAVVAFIDDDAVPVRTWLAAGRAALQDAPADVLAVTGAIEMARPGRPTEQARDAVRLAEAEFTASNCFVRASLLAQLEGFDERYTCACREDVDMHFRILAAGGRVERAAAAQVVQPLPVARWGAELAAQRKVQFDALLYKKHRLLYLSRIARRTPWAHYASVVAVLIGLLSFVVAGLSALDAWSARALVMQPAASGITTLSASTGAPVADLSLSAALPAWFSAAPLAWSLCGLALAVWLVLTISLAARRLARTSLHPAHVAEVLVTALLIPPASVYWRLYGACKFRVAFL